jgi:DNA-directed RNA polymerase subunit RPC12/RpoP
MYSGAHLLIHVLLPVLDSPDVGTRLVSLRMLGQEVYEKQHVSADELRMLQRVLDLLCDRPLLKKVPGTGYICPDCGEKTVLPRSYRYASMSCERCQHRAPLKRGVDALYLVLPHGEIEDPRDAGDLPSDGTSPALLVLDDFRAKPVPGRVASPASTELPRFYTGRGEASRKLFAAVREERPGILVFFERGPGGDFERTYLAEGRLRALTTADSPDCRYDELTLAAARELDPALVEFIESGRYVTWHA